MFRDVRECLDAGNRLHTLLASQKPSRKSIPILIDVEQGICNGSLGVFKNSIQQYIIFVYSFFYAPPQKVAGYYVIPSELLSVCPSVCPSVRPSAVDHSCPLHNFDTVQDNFTKLSTNVKHDHTTCRD